MLRASALYLVIVIALVIGILCSALIVSAYFYKFQYQRKFRYDRMESNITSAINILLTADDQAYKEAKTLSLFGDDQDSVIIRKMPWGVYDIGMAMSLIQKDTLYKTFSMANIIDSTKWAALYLIDEDRPLSVSGNTMIRGDAFVPKAGLKEAYVDGKGYTGDKRLVIGTSHNSQKKLPDLSNDRLQLLEQQRTATLTADSILPQVDSLDVSFLKPTRIINFKKKVVTLSSIKLSGNIILLSDTAININATVTLDNVLVFAKSISVKAGFKGNCQLFAVDSIGLEKGCTFNYPSCLGIIRNQDDKKTQGTINIGEQCSISGIVFTYEKVISKLQTLIRIGKNVDIRGQLYAMGLLQFNQGGEVDGGVFTNRFLYKSTYTTYENYLINTTLNANALSSYYLTSPLMPVAQKKQRILQWLEAN